MPLLNELMGAGMSGKAASLLAVDFSTGSNAGTQAMIPLRYLGKQCYVIAHGNASDGPNNSQTTPSVSSHNNDTIDKCLMLASAGVHDSDGSIRFIPVGDANGGSGEANLGFNETSTTDSFNLSSDHDFSAYNYRSFLIATLD